MTGADVMAELIARWPQLQARLIEHLMLLTLLPVALAVAIGVPLGLLAVRRPGLRTLALGAANVVQTIPSLAMLAFLLPLLGIGKRPAIVALTLYAVLPILQNTLVGILGVPRAVKDAADGMGFSAWQRLRWVELPLAAPVILGGIRTAAVICVGIATLSAFIGAGGLGDFINRGLALNRAPLLLIGAGTAAVLALFLDFALETLNLRLQPGRPPAGLRKRMGVLAVLTVLGAALLLVPSSSGTPTGADEQQSAGSGTIRIGSKNFTEQILLGEILAQLLEARTDLNVQRVFNLGGTIVCHRALLRGGIDLYVEYTGTALTAILKQPPPAAGERAGIFPRVRAGYQSRFGLRALPPLGFDNTYAITVRTEDAVKHGWKTISDLAESAASLRGGFTAEFTERSDGLSGMSKAYDLRFGSVRDLSPELMVAALAGGEVDVICAFATDGRIAANAFTVLEDDRTFFPPYEAFPVMRKEILDQHPEAGAAVQELVGRLDATIMRRLNAEVDVTKRTVREVAREFLREENLIE